MNKLGYIRKYPLTTISFMLFTALYLGGVFVPGVAIRPWTPSDHIVFIFAIFGLAIFFNVMEKLLNRIGADW